MSEPLTLAEMTARYKEARRNLSAGRFADDKFCHDYHARQRLRLLALSERPRLRKIEAERITKRLAAIESAASVWNRSKIIACAIIAAAAFVSGISVMAILSASREANVVYWRHIAILLAKQR